MPLALHPLVTTKLPERAATRGRGRAVLPRGRRSGAYHDPAHTNPVAFRAHQDKTAQRSGSTLQPDNRQMPPALEVVDLQLEPVARLATQLVG
jgi:hypothetical protein